MPELAVQQFYIKALKENAGTNSSGDFYIRKNQKKIPELMVPMIFI